MSKPTTDKNCNHAIALWEGCDEAGLVYNSSKESYPPNMIEVAFNYCPLCGEKLTPP